MLFASSWKADVMSDLFLRSMEESTLISDEGRTVTPREGPAANLQDASEKQKNEKNERGFVAFFTYAPQPHARKGKR